MGFFFIKTELKTNLKYMELNTFKIVSENYKNQEKTKKIPIKQKKHPHIIAYSLERKITNIFQMHKKIYKNVTNTIQYAQKKGLKIS